MPADINPFAVRESAIERYLVEEVRKAGGKAVKLQKLRGWPDRMVLWPRGVMDFVELKRPKGGRFEPLQLRTHEQLRNLGYNVLVVNTKPQVEDYVSSRANPAKKGSTHAPAPAAPQRRTAAKKVAAASPTPALPK